MNDVALTGERLLGVAELWQRRQRDVEVRFGGVSMRPTIEPGEPLRLVCGDRAPRPGDVIAFVSGDQVAVHRLLASSREGEWLVTIGDAHHLPDAPIRRDAVIGRVVRRDGQEITSRAGRTFARLTLAAALDISVPMTRFAVTTVTKLRTLGVTTIGRIISAVFGRRESRITKE